MKKSNKYLYGEATPMPVNQEVIDDRVAKLQYELTQELNRSYKVRDFSRVKDLQSAINFWLKINS